MPDTRLLINPIAQPPTTCAKASPPWPLDLADVGGDLADELLVVALHDDRRGHGGLELHAGGGVDGDGVREAELQVELAVPCAAAR